MHLIYPVKEVLSRYRDTDGMICEIEQETHLFYECPWKIILGEYGNLCVGSTCVRLDVRDIILYFDHNIGWIGLLDWIIWEISYS